MSCEEIAPRLVIRSIGLNVVVFLKLYFLHFLIFFVPFSLKYINVAMLAIVLTASGNFFKKQHDRQVWIYLMLMVFQNQKLRMLSRTKMLERLICTISTARLDVIQQQMLVDSVDLFSTYKLIFLTYLTFGGISHTTSNRFAK